MKNLTLEGSTAVLAWRAESLAWDGGGAFVVNGTLDDTLAPTESGIELRADQRNYVEAGNFSEPAAWRFEDGLDGETTVGWDAVTESARFAHASAEAPRVQWDSMDSIENNWTSEAPVDSRSTISQIPLPDGSGWMQVEVETGIASSAWAGARRLGSFNWSAYDRLLLWIRASSQLPLCTATFNVSAAVESTIRYTTAMPIGPSWNEVVVDLTELGPSRDVVREFVLRINGPSLDCAFHFDDLRLSRAKGSSAPAGASTGIAKGAQTPDAPGTAVLSADWTMQRSSNVSTVELAVNVTGPPGTFQSVVTIGGASGLIVADVSSWMASAGSYSLTLRARFDLNTTYASRGEVYVDNVTLRFPDRRNGTFTSIPIHFDGRAEALSLAWNATSPNGTTLSVAIRSADTPLPPDETSWGAWWETTSPGTYPYVIRARYFQIRARLGTVNASLTPRLEDFHLNVRQRAQEGFLATPEFDAGEEFGRWIQIGANTAPIGAGSVSFEINNGTTWRLVRSDTDLAGLPSRVQVRVTLLSEDLLESPALVSFVLEFELRGSEPPVWEWLTANSLFVAGLIGAALSVAGFTIAANRLLAIEDLFLVSRDGRLIHHNTRRMRAQWDEDTFAGMLTAIAAFVRDSFREERGDLNRFEFAGKTVLMERVNSIYVAAIYAGRVPRRASKNLRTFASGIHDRFGDRLSSWTGSPEDLQDLKELTDRFVGKPRYRPRRSRGAG